MHRPSCFCRWLTALVALAVCGPVFGQQAKPAAAAKSASNAAEQRPYRRLAPGVMESVDPARQVNETVSRHDIVELLAIDASFDWAKDVPFRHDVWALEFQFKVPRLIWVDVPQASGKMQRKLIRYLVYSVTNPGKIMHPVEDKPLGYKTFEGKQLFQLKSMDQPVRFIPQFLLEAHESLEDKVGFTKVYPDRVIPVAVGPIQVREDPHRRFLTTVEMCSREIAAGETVWGVATWEDVDPRTRRFSIYVGGLTNAYRWKDQPGADQAKAKEPTLPEQILPGRRLLRKTLKLNFWRPGDEFSEREEETRYGLPGGVDYEWVYR
jgi:hypothetical protein